MPQMGITGIAHDFYPYHTKRSILVVLNGVFFYGLGKTWPASARIKFYGGVE
jgi:hypothetical protein